MKYYEILFYYESIQNIKYTQYINKKGQVESPALMPMSCFLPKWKGVLIGCVGWHGVM